MQNPGTVLFVGQDICERTTVLATVGYNVLHCECDAIAVVDTVAQTPVDAVLFHCDPTAPAHLMVAAARAASHAPIILFGKNSSSYDPSDYDVIVPALCSPGEWLPAITEAIERHRDLDHPKPPQPVPIDPPRKGHKYNPTR